MHVVQDLFEGVLGADFMGEFAKPDAEAFDKVGCRLVPACRVLQYCTIQFDQAQACHMSMSWQKCKLQTPLEPISCRNWPDSIH